MPGQVYKQQPECRTCLNTIRLHNERHSSFFALARNIWLLRIEQSDKQMLLADTKNRQTRTKPHKINNYLNKNVIL